MEHKGKRPCKTCHFADRKIILHVKNNPFDSANDTFEKMKLSVLENTGCRWFQHSGFLSIRESKSSIAFIASIEY